MGGVVSVSFLRASGWISVGNRSGESSSCSVEPSTFSTFDSQGDDLTANSCAVEDAQWRMVSKYVY